MTQRVQTSVGYIILVNGVSLGVSLRRPGKGKLNDGFYLPDSCMVKERKKGRRDLKLEAGVI